MSKIFADGCSFFPPRDNAPSWIKGQLSFRVKDFIEFLEKHKNEKGFVAVDINLSQNGGYYCSLNDWKPRVKKLTKEEETIS